MAYMCVILYVQVRGQPRLEHLPSWSAYVSKQMVIQDMVAVLSSQSLMAAEVVRLIKGMKLEVSITVSHSSELKKKKIVFVICLCV